jgi:Uri superfamily endonuclease
MLMSEQLASLFSGIIICIFSDHRNLRGRCLLKRQDRGTYLLVIKLKENQRISIGQQGTKKLSKGIYLYVGRARRGLQSRIKRHLSQKKKIFWHIDYLLQKAEIQEVWIKRNFFDECQTALEVKAILKDTSSPLRKFGASDCNCPSHLFYFPESIIFLESLRKRLSFKKVDIHGNQI